MKLTCSQMDVLISFYIEDELCKSLKYQVEEHLKQCSICRAKYDIIKSMLVDIKNKVYESDSETPCLRQGIDDSSNSKHYRVFKNNLSAYIDNELSTEENVKIKKFTINNKFARKDLEDSYNIRRLMNESYNKSKEDAKSDYTKNIMKQLEIEDEDTLGIHPVIKLLVIFALCVIIFSVIILYYLGL